jgi:hypothetical protein
MNVDYDYDVIVVGGGSAGIASAIAAAKTGAKTMLIESGPFLGGDFISGLPIDGCMNARGEWIVGGVIKELFQACEKRGGYIGPICDYRALWIVCTDPLAMQFAIVDVVDRYPIDVLLYSFANDVEVHSGEIKSISVVNKLGERQYSAKVFVDCTGDGDIAIKAGNPYEQGGESPQDLQPVSIVYRLENVDTKALLNFVRNNPDNVSLGESPWMGGGAGKEELIDMLVRQGYAKVFFTGEGPLLSQAIADGIISNCSMLAITPYSVERNGVSVNSTRLPVDATKTDALSQAIVPLFSQVDQGVRFLKERVPGFENAYFVGVAPRIGIRETRRLIGDYILNSEDVLESKKRSDGIAKGGHEYDIHGKNKDHIRMQLKDGGSYDIPLGCLLPKELKNVLIAGRNISAERGAHSTARVMGTCMAMGHAAGVAAAMSAKTGVPLRSIDIDELRAILRSQGAVLDGTH